MSDQDYERDAEDLDWQLDDEQSSTTDDAPSSEATGSEGSSEKSINGSAEKSAQEQGNHQGDNDYRSDG